MKFNSFLFSFRNEHNHIHGYNKINRFMAASVFQKSYEYFNNTWFSWHKIDFENEI